MKLFAGISRFLTEAATISCLAYYHLPLALVLTALFLAFILINWWDEIATGWSLLTNAGHGFYGFFG